LPDQSPSAQHFLNLIKRSRRGKFKVYVGMSAGVGKSYRMLQEAHSLLRNGVNVKIGFIETHGRVETEALVAGLPMIPRRKLFYKSRELEEMDVLAVVMARPEVVIVDELAHTNLPGSTHEKRWEDVLEILEAGISVISAVNIQHLESLNDEVRAITGIEVTERVPDHVLRQADEVQTALANFFQPDKILQLRELALKEVAAQVVRKIDTELPADSRHKPERFLACVSSNDKTARAVIRKTAR